MGTPLTAALEPKEVYITSESAAGSAPRFNKSFIDTIDGESILKTQTVDCCHKLWCKGGDAVVSRAYR